MRTPAQDVSRGALEDKLLACQREALLGKLTGLILHEYNNLMTPVIARAQDAVMRDDTAAMRKALDVTVRQTDHALRFTREVLGLAQGDDPPPRACDLAELVATAVARTVRPYEKDGIDLHIDVPAGLVVWARPLLMGQLLLNLLLNARAAMKGRSGTIRIRARRVGADVEIDVCDSGAGMDPRTIDEVINPFLAAEEPCCEASSLVGLGLHACRIIAQQHGASIRALANDGPGCTFRVRWPAGDAQTLPNP